MYLDSLGPEHCCQTCWPPLLEDLAGSSNPTIRPMWAGTVAHFVEYLPRMHEALGSKLVAHKLDREVLQTCKLSTSGVEARGSEVQGYLWLHKNWMPAWAA